MLRSVPDSLGCILNTHVVKRTTMIVFENQQELVLTRTEDGAWQEGPNRCNGLLEQCDCGRGLATRLRFCRRSVRTGNEPFETPWYPQKRRMSEAWSPEIS